MRKKRVLFLSEASYLGTGYATYSREVMSKLHKSGKYEIAELSTYGGEEDPRRLTIPWKNYPCMPKTPEEQQAYSSQVVNQFGSWRFERACLDFKPDIIACIRDFWMDSFVRNSPYRRIFKWVWMPTVDAAPQDQEWVSCFSDCDAILTYSDWAGEQLKKQGGKSINWKGTTSPSASSDFVPAPLAQAKVNLGIDPSHQIIGTVMRNQRRKLYPDLFKAFSKFLKETKRNDVYLYCHTGYPDNGWNLASLLIEHEITSKVYFTYTCRCGHYGAYKFSDIAQQCPKCKNFTLVTTSVNAGLNEAQLASVYQSFDLYCQAANSEGFGIPQVEAAACGVPVACTNYSAMEDVVKKVNAFPIKPITLYKELETGCERAVIDTDNLKNIFKEFFDTPFEIRNQERLRVRASFLENYSWDKTAQLWDDVFQELDYARWDLPPVVMPVPEKLPEVRNNKDLVDWAIRLISLDDRNIDSYIQQSLLKDLNFGLVKRGTSGYLLPESSLFDQENYAPMNSQILFDAIVNRINLNNFWEKVRAGMIQLQPESWLK